MGNSLKSFRKNLEIQKFSKVGYVFGVNFLIYLALLEVEVPYTSLAQVWSVNMNYRRSFVDKRRKEI